MAYIEKEPLIEFITKGLTNPDKTKAFGYDAIEILAEIEYAPTADVVPKSEFDRVYNELEHLKSSVLPVLRIDLQMANTRAYEADAEVERLTVDLEAMRTAANSYKMHYENAKSEVIDEFAERLKDYPITNLEKSLQISDIIDEVATKMKGGE